MYQAMAVTDFGSDSDIEPSNDIELAGSDSVDLEPANVASSWLLDVLKLEKLRTLKRVTDMPHVKTSSNKESFQIIKHMVKYQI